MAEIKLSCLEKACLDSLVLAVRERLSRHIVSSDGKNAFEALVETIKKSSKTIFLADAASHGKFEQCFSAPNLNMVAQQQHVHDIFFSVTSSIDLRKNANYSGSLELVSKGYINNQCQFTHTISIPNRGPEVSDYVSNYIAWQLNQFILQQGI